MDSRPGPGLCCALALAGLVLAACGKGPDRNGRDGGDGDTAAFADSARAQCTVNSPMRQVGAGIDAPGRLEMPLPVPLGSATGACGSNAQYRFGSGLHDITGVVANTNGMGWENPAQVFGGIHQRQYARAFAIESPCNGKRVMMVIADLGIMTGALRLDVLDAIAADPELRTFYGPENLMLSATHTHEGPAGYSHFIAHNALHFGYDDATFRAAAQGIFQALKRAHANLQAHADSAPIRMGVGELLDTSIQRSLPAYLLNSEAERREFLNSRGDEIQTDKRVVQLNLVRGDGSAAGIVNWFGVHATIMGEALPFVSSDLKGYASLGFERIMKTDYTASAGPDNFVAAFPQADEGDASPNLFIVERPYPDPTRGGGKDDFESNAISGTKHLAKALELYGQGSALSGPVDYRLFHVKMDEVTVSDPVVLASLHHPAAMDAAVKRTCSPALGPSFAAGAEDGPGPAVEGVSCTSSPDVIAAAAADFQTLLSIQPPGGASGFPPNVLPLNLVSAALMCNLHLLPANPVLGDFSCQAEKPVALPLGGFAAAEPVVLPFQIFRVGNLALVGLPWEVPTMSARRIRKMMLQILAPVGVDTVVVAPLTNDFVHYLPTREEYSSQQYEGASDIFGPWTLAAVQQEVRRLAVTLRDGTPSPAGPAYVDGSNPLIRPPYMPSDFAAVAGGFGALVKDVPATASPGDTVSAEFQAGHPRNDLKTQSSYVYAEHQKSDGSWEVVAQDRDPELLYAWKAALPSPLPVDPPLTGPSTAQAVWTIPRNAPAGTYRLRHEGAAQTSPGAPKEPYSGVSSPFLVAGPASACP